MLVRLYYASRATEDKGADIDLILAQSRKSNPRNGITGILCFGGGVYLQVLEGSREAVNALYARIHRDPRHHDLVLLHYEEVMERRFGSWVMGQVQMNRVNTGLLLKYGASAELDPQAVSGRASAALLDELVATASIIGRA